MVLRKEKWMKLVVWKQIIFLMLRQFQENSSTIRESKSLIFRFYCGLQGQFKMSKIFMLIVLIAVLATVMINVVDGCKKEKEICSSNGDCCTNYCEDLGFFSECTDRSKPQCAPGKREENGNWFGRRRMLWMLWMLWMPTCSTLSLSTMR
ncbi:hypothetical protein KQX54_004980 [Cotesia glomerata]|uniref:Uncharacterized protein n=1 Tax=Cotesia glomerata TaxID=32391 RepID=A0AAV7ILI9_COTGL|nr:hypothetical protein KQX54_004980 [Cotesia glomerata]